QADSVIVSGTLEYMTCSDMQCVLGDADFTFRLSGLEKTATATAAEKITQPSQPMASDDSTSLAISPENIASDTSVANTAAAAANGTTPATGQKSLWGVFFLSLLAGLGGLLTPCVYPMIPMTVSFFLRGNKKRSKAISEALVFGLSIVLLYTLIGVLVAIFKNPNAVNNFTTHWLTNLIFFAIFMVLAASFFGAFEIMLPSGLANKVDQQADKGGYIGAFFMALAMAILSFSCTGPIIASLLIKASQGDVLEPVIGMAGFSLVFALPFTLFAIFPSWLQGLPKSGGWLNAVKVVFAFIMLAFSLYFLAKVDQSYHLGILTREIFISIWTVIFVMLGFYLLGRLKFAHDSALPYIGVPRLIFALASFSFGLYLFTGLFGNELKGLSSIIPPPGKETAINTSPSASAATAAPLQEKTATALCNTPRYADFLSLPHALQGYFDYEEALACAREKGKAVLVDFVGHTCSNCKKMYGEVWSDPRVLKLLNEKFIVVALYTDDKTKLPESEWITSTVDGKVKNTIGRKNQDLQIARFGSNALPLYAIVDGSGNNLSDTYYTYDPDVEKFIRWLQAY
ncbi:MAG: thioredoxin family protein, partial [Bacteroidales bacterium]|nr:thioredoxin family protein [Bacteroidales bacterium]